jgi:hypothetical protein
VAAYNVENLGEDVQELGGVFRAEGERRPDL